MKFEMEKSAENKAYNAWLTHLAGTPDGALLEKMQKSEMLDAFSADIAFGTGGLRGIMGIGTNRLNTHTVRRVTQGLAKTIMLSDKPQSVCVAYDTRQNSAEFAELVSSTLSAYGIAVYIFQKPMPTPALSFVIRHLKLGWGVVITASHNPPEYNGYKVYDSRGVQATDNLANQITANINNVKFFEPIPAAEQGTVTTISAEIEAAYEKQIISYLLGNIASGNKESERKKLAGSGVLDIQCKASEYPIIYSALHGAGASVIPSVLGQLGFTPNCIQQSPDGFFGGMKTPNPEDSSVYSLAISEAKKSGANIILATDPDCDRVGVLQKTANGYEPLSGNQIGALLIDYLAQSRGVSHGDTVITTIVSGTLGELLAKSLGLDFKRLLTGFKYIGDYAENLPKDKRFFFGYEESFGFLAGDGARDKDAVIASALISQMAVHYENQKKTLLDRWNELSLEHGYCLESLHSVNMPSSEQKIIMDKLRSRNGIKLSGLTEIQDYLTEIDGLPRADVIKLFFDDKSWAAFRPSGTEPKIKLYMGVYAKTLEEARTKQESMNMKLLPILEEIS